MRFFIIFIALSGFLMAQSGSKRTCRILFFQAPPDAPQKLYLYDGKASQQVKLPSMNFSEVYVLPPGDLPLALLTEAAIPTVPINPESPKVIVPAGISDFYLLVSTDSKNKTLPVKMQVVDASAASFRNGQMLWYNLTQHDIGGMVGTQRLAIKPMSKLILESPADGANDYNLQLFYRRANDPKVIPLYRLTWLQDPRSKTVVFVSNDSGDDTPRVAAFPDFRITQAASNSEN